MRFSPLITLVLVTLTSWLFLCYAAPILPSATDLLDSISPESEAKFEIGDTAHAQVQVNDAALRELNPLVKLTFQRAIPKPDVNEVIISLALQELETDGVDFEILESYRGDPTRSNRYRVRYSFKDGNGASHFADSAVFHLSPTQQT
ncbi:hypothetical protein BGZ65_006076 [Modicella reniformis]|uniref:Uncharacterized protein n=1 Tax=Modicella reniformis TaxID=1440133 RepID=A0A9P6J5P0_9FUNG|nr:hypothetical protein BGZ65_006076 [Modicella reniformis]